MHHIRAGIRFVVSLCVGTAAWLFLPEFSTPLIRELIAFLLFLWTFNGLSWYILLNRDVKHIQQIAAKDDGSLTLIFLLVLISVLASFLIILQLVTGSDGAGKNPLTLVLAVFVILGAWSLMHTVFTFHYAHMYYNLTRRNSSRQTRPLEFPGDEDPDYLDFAYFSFVIGCTFQVSDVEIADRKLRRMALLHSLIAFIVNSFVVALMVNLIAGMGGR